MGAICSKQNMSNITNPQKRIKFATVIPMDDNNEFQNHIGIEFQYLIQQNQPNYHNKKQIWEEYYQKRQDFINDEQYITLLRSPQALLQVDNNQKLQEQKVSSHIQAIAIALKEPFKHLNLDLFDAYILKELNPIQFNSYLMDGAIPKFRWNCWMAQVYQNSFYDANLYSYLKSQTLPEKVSDDIKKDQNRTFPRHSYFKEPNKGQQQLVSVLHALSIQYPDIGYAQGMNLLIGFCLIISGGNEEEVFWFINFINQNERFNWWEIYRVEFIFAQNLCQIFQDNLQRLSPNLFNHFQKNGIFSFQYVWQWILTQFLYSFPIQIVLFFWDFILATNIYSILKIGLVFLSDIENVLIDYDINQLSEFFSLQTKKQKNIDITNLLNKAKNIKICISDEQNIINTNCKPKTLK